MFFLDDKFKDYLRERHSNPQTPGSNRVFRATLPASVTDQSRMIGADDLERTLTFVRERAAGQKGGILGPQSVTWRVNREAAVFLGAGRAMLLQLTHPWVAAAITEHSRTLADPIGRFHRTFSTMYTMVFGELDLAFAAARRLHRRHAAISGTLPRPAGPFPGGSAYLANEPAALLWVHATLVDTALMAHDLVLLPLTAEDRERYYTESRIFAALFGIPDAIVPPTWQEFAAYTAGMLASETLQVTPEARAIADILMSGAGRWLRPPAWYRTLTASLLPPQLQMAYGLPFGSHAQARAETALRRTRHIYSRLPKRLRYVGPYQEACARLAGHEPDLFVRGLNQLWIGRVRLASGHDTGRRN